MGMLSLAGLGVAQANISPSREDEPFWERIYTLPDTCGINYDIAANANGVIFVATDKGVYKSYDNAEHWEIAWQPSVSWHKCTAMDIAPNGRICLGTNSDYLCFSEDEGTTWEDTEVPMSGWMFNQVKFFGNDTIFALPRIATSGACIDYSYDGGNTWDYSVAGDWYMDYPTEIVMTPKRTFFVTLGFYINKEVRDNAGGLFRSLNHGQHWERVTIPTYSQHYPFYSLLYCDRSSKLIVGSIDGFEVGEQISINQPTETVQNRDEPEICVMNIWGGSIIDDQLMVLSGGNTLLSINDGEDYTAFPGPWGGRQVVCGADGFLYSLQSNTNRDLLRSTYSVDELLSMLSTSEKIAEQGVSIYPNPTSDLVIVKGKNLKSAEVLNMLGQRVAKVQGQGETLQIDIAKLPAGVYFVNVTDEEGRKCVRKVVKE
jgi:hypothetical protein